MSSTNIDTLVASLYQCVETRSIEVSFDCSLSHLRASSFNLFVTAKRLHPVVCGMLGVEFSNLILYLKTCSTKK
jgi:hypothetical protein